MQLRNYLFKISAGFTVFIGVTGPSHAQDFIIPDNTLGNERTQVNSNIFPLDIITGGAQRGPNLFHSFELFNVGEGRITQFNAPADIQSIFNRVTGNVASEILGTIESTGTSDLFFINPNGIIFGENATLNVGGAFIATTADSVIFLEQGEFSAATPESPSNLLTINPTAFLFNQANSSSIEVFSRAAAGLAPSGNFETFGLRVPDGENLILLGGDVILQDRGGLAAYSGKIEIGGLREPGIVSFETNSDSFSLSFSENSLKADVFLNEGSGIITAAGDNGSVFINANDLTVQNGQVFAGIEANIGGPNSEAGDIAISLDGTLRMNGGRFVNYVFSEGAGGEIIIKAKDIQIENAGQISALVFGQGQAGNISITTSGDISIDGRSQETDFPSAIFNRLLTNSEGEGGEIAISARNLSITNRAQIVSATQGGGNAGNIVINIEDQITLLNSIIISDVSEGQGIGNGGDIDINTGVLTLLNGAALLADTENVGTAGNITIQASEGIFLRGLGPSALDSRDTVPSQISATVENEAIGEGGNISITADILSLTDKAFIRSTSFGRGNAGDIAVDVSSLNLVSGATINAATENTGNAGSLRLSADEEIFVSGSDGTRLSAISSASRETAQGNGGPISITTPNLILMDRAIITATSQGTGIAGDINLTIENLEIIDASIETTAFQAAGGDIRVNALQSTPTGIVILRGDGDITTDSFGNGGNIALNTIVIALDDSDILARSQEAKGGNITLGPFFSDTIPIGAMSPTEGNNRVDISADGRIESGIISTADTNFIENNLEQLPENLIDTNTLVASSCLARLNNTGSSLLITNADGLPAAPNSSSNSHFSTGGARLLEEESLTWQPGTAIVEPSGLYQLTDGRLILSRECN